MILASQRCSEDYQLLPTLIVNIMLLLQTLVQGMCMWTAGLQESLLCMYTVNPRFMKVVVVSCVKWGTPVSTDR